MLYFHIKIRAQTCYQWHSGNGISKLENLWEISRNPSPISRFPSPEIRFSSPKIRFSSYEIRFTKIGSLLSSTAFRFLQRLSAFSNGFLIFFNGFPLSPTAFRISPTAFRFSSTAFCFPRNPRKSIYGEKYTKFCYSSFVFFATRSPSFVIPAKQYLHLTQHLQAKIIRGDNYCGRNSTHISKPVSWGNNDGANNEVVTQFCKSKLFPHYKFLHQGWLEYSIDDTLSLCYKIFKTTEVPITVTTEVDKEFYWKTKILPIINKKLCKMRSNFNSAVKERYLSRFTGRLLCR